ncbi:MAG: acyltransferase [Desulfobacteraceae bacterium]|nr:acyltransferase [Desulfobacteraceae bacterium]
MYNINIEKNKDFNGCVESLRGVAAMMVALFHCIIIINRDESLMFQKIVTGSLLFWFNGAAAVSLFFVISGYVLGLSMDKMTKMPFWQRYAIFLARRILRIYPMLAVSVILLSLYLCTLWKADDSVQKMTTFGIYYLRDFNLRDIAYNILGIEKISIW